MKAFFKRVNWDEVDSNVERLPYLAQQLKKNDVYKRQADTCPSIAESVFTSMPFSSASVAKVWRKSWNLTCLQPACSRMSCSLRRTTPGVMGQSSFTGDGNIQRESTVFLYSRSTATTVGGRTILRTEFFVLGVLI